MSSWNYVVTAHKPTSVTHSVVGNFTSPTELNLIIAKCTRIEIHLLTPQGLEPIYDVPIYGRITTLELFRLQGESQDLLFICTERYNLCVLSYDSSTKEIITKAMSNVADRIGRPTDNGQIGIIDPDCRLIGLHLYDGLFKVIPIDAKGNLKEAFNIRLEELYVLSIKFLYGCVKPTIAVLYEDTRHIRHLKTYEVSIKEKEFVEGPFQQNNLDLGSGLLIPIPAPLGGVIIIGERVIVYHNGSFFKAIEIRSATMRTYTRIDADGSRYLLNDNLGTLFLLVLTHKNYRVTGLRIEELGETSTASSLSYLDNGFVFVGSNMGDSQLIKLNSKPNEDGKFLEVVDNYTNLGPISDFCVVDLEHQGQGQVITCSGAYKDGSLRIIRNGIGINEQANVDLPGIKGMWALRKSFESVNDYYLVVTFVTETRILAINEEDELEETEISGFDSEKQSLYCGNAVHDQIIQVTSSEVRLVNSSNGDFVCNWFPVSGLSINVIASNPSQILLATGGGNIVYLDIEEGRVVEKKHSKLEYEISCLDINPLKESETKSNFAAVGMWTDFSVRVLSLPNLEFLCSEKLSDEVIPRSLLFSSFEGIPYLLCALGDGNLFNFVLKPESGQITDKKKISLGTKPISLRTFQSKNTTHVFAASDRPTVIYSSNHKLLYSNVNVKDVNHVCPFNSEAFPDSLAIGKEGQLSIGTIDDIQKLHIRTVPLAETPRRICHHEPANAIAVCTVKTSMIVMNEDEYELSFLRVYDDQTFECIASYQLDTYEMGSSILSSSFAEDKNSYIIVGTAYALPEESEPTKGRILVFTLDNQKLNLVCEKETRGAVYNLNSFHGKLIAGINQKLMLYKWTVRVDGSHELQTECSHHGHIVSLHVKTRGDYIVLGDLMKSISLLVYKPQEGAIEERAKDPHANWMTAVEILDDDYYLGAENSFNLLVLHKSNDVTSEDEKNRLEVVGEFHLGDFVNKFQPGSLVMKLPDSEISKMDSVLFATSHGMIGVIASLKQEQYAILSRLQQCLEDTIKGVGGFSHKSWRSFSNQRKTTEAFNFIDGDLIESFLDLSKPMMEKVATVMEYPLEEIIKFVEDLTRLH